MYNIHTHTHTECFTKLVPKSGICFTKHCIHHSRKFKRERKFKIYKNLQTKAFKLKMEKFTSFTEFKILKI